jgi:hypothetical protein
MASFTEAPYPRSSDGFRRVRVCEHARILSRIRVEGINTVVLRDHEKRIPQSLIRDFQLLGIKGFRIGFSTDRNDEWLAECSAVHIL